MGWIFICAQDCLRVPPQLKKKCRYAALLPVGGLLPETDELSANMGPLTCPNVAKGELCWHTGLPLRRFRFTSSHWWSTLPCFCSEFRDPSDYFELVNFFFLQFKRLFTFPSGEVQCEIEHVLFLAKQKHIPGSTEWLTYLKDKQVQMVFLGTHSLCTHILTHSQASSGLDTDIERRLARGEWELG